MAGKISNPRDLLVLFLGQLLHVERRLAGGVIRDLADGVHDEELRSALERHLEETVQHVERVESAFRRIEVAPTANLSRPFESSVAQHGELAANRSSSRGSPTTSMRRQRSRPSTGRSPGTRRCCGSRPRPWPSCSSPASTMNDVPQHECRSISSGTVGMAEVVVVTGASAGVGRAIAHAFARRGARVGLLARGEPALQAAAREVEELGGSAHVVATDVADFAQVDAAADAVEAAFGPIDVWVNNAMATVFARFLDLQPDEFRRATEVTYLGAVHGTMAALQRMVPRDRGTIVQVGSALSYRAIPLQAAYCGAKFGVRGFTDSVRTELLHDGSNVWITMVQLPAVNTPQFSWCRTKLPNHPKPVPPIFEPEVPAEAVYWAAHHRRRELDVGFSAVKAIVGNKLAPRFADWYLARTGFDSQQIENMPVGERRDNLFEPVPDEAVTHGIFEAQAKRRSYQLYVTTHRRLIAGLLAAAAGAAAGRHRHRG